MKWIDTVIEFMQKMPPTKWAMALGMFGMFVSAVSTGIMGIQVDETMKFAVFGVCAIVFVAGLGGAIYVKKLDAELREKKLDQGLPPEDDKTIFR